MSNVQRSWCVLLLLIGSCAADPELVYNKKELSNIFICPYKSTVANNVVWSFINNTIFPFPISDGTTILPLNSPHPRASVVGDHTAGVYNLNMSGLQESDEGLYRCTVGANQQKEYKLELLAAPSSLTLQDVTDNKILGTEGQSLTLRCTATGGKPPPLVSITVDNVSKSTEQTVEYTIPTLERRHYGQRIYCQANSSALISPLFATATLYLNLKPLQPIFSLDPVITEDTKPLVVSCTSTGSRPQATFQWTLGLNNITSYSTTQITNTADDTYNVTSTLTYTIDRTSNGQTITCIVLNVVATNGVQTSKILDVKFAPKITVSNVSYSQNTTTRILTCKPVGNPAKYIYHRWQHKSIYGELIRELNGGQDGILTLPSVPVEARYQDSGEYVCIASNGINDRYGKVNQTGSGYVSVNAQPVLVNGNKDTEYGEFVKDVDINVYVYSVPKYILVKWYKSSTTIVTTDKYTLTETAVTVADIFHGTEIRLDGYRLTLTIKNLVESDFNVSYIVQLLNGFGQDLGHTTLLVTASPPQTPINFTVLISSDSSIVVQWEAGYNGAHEQAFYVEYRKFGSKTWIEVKIQNTKQTGRQTHTLTGLQEGTFYELRVYAENMFNKSSPTQTEKIETMRGCKLSSSDAVTGGVAGGLSMVIVIMLIMIIVLILQKQRIRKHRSMTNTSRWKDDASYLNPINCTELDEQKDTLNKKEKNSERSTQEYETLGMKDTPNTYSELLTQQDKKMSKSVQEYETLGMADNPSTYSELHGMQDQKQSETIAEHYKSLSDQDKATAYENTNVKQGQTQSKYKNVKT